ncbi:MAG: alpha/beta fold hydrolase [Sulfurimonas sp.]|nr:alpha/beta fold hydrolase [Sulfurimonas sp.]
MGDKMYQASQFVISMIERTMANNITYSGEKNLDKNFPILFVANHFTRIETFLVPYVLYNKFGFKVRSLADHYIFAGILGDYLSAVGTVSTKDELRNEKILGDLLTARENWLIYPEGSMIKSKKILLSEDTFEIEDKKGLRNIFTGSAVLALQSELEKSKYFEALNRCDVEAIKEFKEKYFIKEDEELSYSNTHIIPVNISYTPIRTGENSISDLAKKYIKSESVSLNEEIDIESNLLLNSQIHIHFSKPIDVKTFLFKTKRTLKQENLELDDDTVIKRARVPLTNMMMNEVYKNILITFDHVFALCLEYSMENEFDAQELKARIYLVCRELKKLDIYHLDKILDANLYRLLNGEPYALFDDVLSVAVNQRIIKENKNKIYVIDRKKFKDEHTFHTIRIKNTLRVLLNETMILHELNDCVKYQAHKDIKKVYREVFYIIYNRDTKQFTKDYNKYYSVFDSKAKEIGKPFVLYNENNTVGCVLSHGFKSAPREIELLANYLFDNGINVYAIRLKGHGTMPEDLRDATYKDWYDSFDIGYSALSCVSEKIFVCGFSTGGLIALLKASNTSYKIDGVVCINSAVSLGSIHIEYVASTLDFINSFISQFRSEDDTYESEPEHPEISYKKHYMVSVAEWKKLFDIVEERLKHISVPTLIIQGDKDPVVDPKSADIIYDTIKSTIKEKYIVKSDKHVLPLDASVNQDIFKKITKFIKSTKGY